MAELTKFTYLEPIKIKVERGQRGGVGWEISIHGKDADKMLTQIREIEARLIKFELETPPPLQRNPIKFDKEK